MPFEPAILYSATELFARKAVPPAQEVGRASGGRVAQYRHCVGARCRESRSGSGDWPSRIVEGIMNVRRCIFTSASIVITGSSTAVVIPEILGLRLSVRKTDQLLTGYRSGAHAESEPRSCKFPNYCGGKSQVTWASC